MKTNSQLFGGHAECSRKATNIRPGHLLADATLKKASHNHPMRRPIEMLAKDPQKQWSLSSFLVKCPYDPIALSKAIRCRK